MQLIYIGKTNQNIPRIVFPERFSKSYAFTNTEDSLKFVNEIIIHCVHDERSKLKLPKEQKALMVIDVFMGQITDAVAKQHQELKILLT